jgi:hypothetical protein
MGIFMAIERPPQHTAHLGAQPGEVAGVYSVRGAAVGKVARSGHVFNRSGEPIGIVGPDGRVWTPAGTVLGRGSPTGEINDQEGNRVGQVLPYGWVVDGRGQVIGRASLILAVSLQQVAGAAFLLLPVERHPG